MPKLRNRALLGTVALVSGAFASQAQNFSLTEIWRVDPGTQPWMGTGSLERGLAYNPVSGNLLLVSRFSGNQVISLNALTGASNNVLNVTGVSGGTFGLNAIDVAADGTIYSANLASGISGSTPFKIYRWANESSAPSVAFNSTTLFPTGRLGDTLAVRGSGNGIQILAGAGTTGSTNNVAMFTTVDGGLTFGATAMNPGAFMASGDARLGLSFGPGTDTFISRQSSTTTRLVTFDTGTLQINGSQAITLPGGGPLEYVENVNGSSDDLLFTLQTPGNATGSRTVRVYDFSNPPTATIGSSNSLQTVGVANSNVSGDFESAVINGETYLFALESNNGLVAYRVAPVPEPGTLALGAVGAGLLVWRLRRKTS